MKDFFGNEIKIGDIVSTKINVQALISYDDFTKLGHGEWIKETGHQVSTNAELPMLCKVIGMTNKRVSLECVKTGTKATKIAAICVKYNLEEFNV